MATAMDSDTSCAKTTTGFLISVTDDFSTGESNSTAIIVAVNHLNAPNILLSMGDCSLKDVSRQYKAAAKAKPSKAQKRMYQVGY